MSAQSLIDQILKSGLSSLGGAASTVRDAGGQDWGKYATGAAAGGALALLLGSRTGRKWGGKALKVGSVAALGALAWKVYQDYQSRQTGTAAPASPAASPPAAAWTSLPAPQAEDHGRAMLKAMIAAAKSDGHLDERERGLLEAEMQRLDAEPELRSWVESELRRPVEPADVAASARTPEMAAEVYLASLIVVDTTTTMERAYLDELARALKLPAGLKADLESRAVSG